MIDGRGLFSPPQKYRVQTFCSIPVHGAAAVIKCPIPSERDEDCRPTPASTPQGAGHDSEGTFALEVFFIHFGSRHDGSLKKCSLCRALQSDALLIRYHYVIAE